LPAGYSWCIAVTLEGFFLPTSARHGSNGIGCWVDFCWNAAKLARGLAVSESTAGYFMPCSELNRPGRPERRQAARRVSREEALFVVRSDRGRADLSSISLEPFAPPALPGARLARESRVQYAERMPTVLRVGGFRFHFYSDEGSEPPHIHVRCAEGECKFWLDPVALARNRGVPAHAVRKMEALVYEHIDLLREKYHEYHPPGNRSDGDTGVD